MKIKKSKSIRNYLIKNKLLINSTLEMKGFEAFKQLLLDLINQGMLSGEINDKEECIKMLDAIPNMKPNHLYSTYITLITCIKVGK